MALRSAKELREELDNRELQKEIDRIADSIQFEYELGRSGLYNVNLSEAAKNKLSELGYTLTDSGMENYPFNISW